MPAIEFHYVAEHPAFRHQLVQMTLDEAADFGFTHLLQADVPFEQGDLVQFVPGAAKGYPGIPDTLLTVAELVGDGAKRRVRVRLPTGQVVKGWIAGSDLKKTTGPQAQETIMPNTNTNPAVTMAANRFERLVTSLTPEHGAARAYELAEEQDHAGYEAYRESQLEPGTKQIGAPIRKPVHETIDDSAVMPALRRIAKEHGLDLDDRKNLAVIMRLRVDGPDRAILEAYQNAGR